ncbi:hypothetical protein IJD44_06235 [bacterium]|nr:hypothetical protein [bacterium]
MQRKSVDYTNFRKQVSELYIAVLTKNLSVREALSSFPQDCEDKTIIAAWHALCHLEADEDLRAKDEMYKKEQDEYINFIAYTLDKGEELPENIVNSYLPYHENALVANSTKIKGILQNLKKFLS